MTLQEKAAKAVEHHLRKNPSEFTVKVSRDFLKEVMQEAYIAGFQSGQYHLKNDARMRAKGLLKDNTGTPIYEACIKQFKRLEPSIGNVCIRAMRKHRLSDFNRLISPEYITSPEKALANGFQWSESKQGFDFWDNLYNNLITGVLKYE